MSYNSANERIDFDHVLPMQFNHKGIAWIIHNTADKNKQSNQKTHKKVKPFTLKILIE